jgi:hypothetical protein
VKPKPTLQNSSHNGDTKWDQEIATLILPAPLRPWHEPGYKFRRVMLVGLVLGAIAGCTSLVANVVGSLLWTEIGGEPLHPLRLIQVYLTFPFGESALQLEGGRLLALGCVLYLGTGMLYGMLFELVLSYFLPRAGFGGRFVACSALALAVWLVNFYGILCWLQPLLFGGRWVIDLVPWWVAAVTHLIFGWTMAFLYPLGVSR